MDLFRKYPAEVQQETFQKLISKAAETEWGKKHDYRSVQSIRDYQAAVPLQNYDDVKPYVDRLREGETNLLWPEDIKWFAKSSGTTTSTDIKGSNNCNPDSLHASLMAIEEQILNAISDESTSW